MQELAARLGNPRSKESTQAALLAFLRARKLEVEVVEVLFVFWIAAKAYGYEVSKELPSNVLRPSILAELLLESIGLQMDTPIGDLVEVPRDFDVPQDFSGVHGVDLSKIFYSSMAKIGHVMGLPLIRQMAFEWSVNKRAYPDAPFQGDPWHFSRPLGEGFIGQISSRTALRMISAYLRTLAVAYELWGMPSDRVGRMALIALPIHPTLAFLRPRRPSWVPSRAEFDGDDIVMEGAIRSLVERVQWERPDDELIAFAAPVAMSMDRCVEISVVRWAQAECGSIADEGLAEHLKDIWERGQLLLSTFSEPLSTTTILVLPDFHDIFDEKSNAWPLAKPIDFGRIGYLQHDLYPERIFFPTMPGNGRLEATPCDGVLEIKSGSEIVADLCYWNVGWGPVRPAHFGGNCGAALVSRGTTYRAASESKMLDTRSFYLWRMKVLHRKSSFDRFEEALTFGATFV